MIEHKKGQVWNNDKNPDMLQFEKETGRKAIKKGNIITGGFEAWLWNREQRDKGITTGLKSISKLHRDNNKTETQMDWAIKMFKAYLKAKNKEAGSIRKVHYWIVVLPEDQRQIPANKTNSGYRLYINTKQEAGNFNRLLTDARLKGRISPALFIDRKNPKIRHAFQQRYKASIEGYDIELETGELLNITIKKMYTWEYFIDWMSISSNIQVEEFNNQSHRLVVAIEKQSDTNDLVNICRKHGADLIEFTGQPSVTREYEISEIAKKDDGRPINVRYIVDLDEAGLNMVKAFERNVKLMYPHRDHIFKRIILTREQANKYNLPASFKLDDKGISEKQKARFRKMTGSDICIELDGLDEDIIADIVDNDLKEFSGIEQDEINTNKIIAKAEEPIKDAKNSIKIEANKKKYEGLRNRQLEIAEKIERFRQEVKGELEKVENDVRKFKNKLKIQINKKLESKE